GDFCRWRGQLCGTTFVHCLFRSTRDAALARRSLEARAGRDAHRDRGAGGRVRRAGPARHRLCEPPAPLPGRPRHRPPARAAIPCSPLALAWSCSGWCSTLWAKIHDRSARFKGMSMRFEGTDTYVAAPDLMLAVNAAVTLERPLLVKGEPGTGKTLLAMEVARAIGRPLVQWHIKSTTKAQQGLYEYDAV